jgi:hypothetical protein
MAVCERPVFWAISRQLQWVLRASMSAFALMTLVGFVVLL